MCLVIDYLKERTQRLKAGEVISWDETLTYGDPYGSVFGPSFNLNKLCSLNFPNGSIFSYANDTALIFSGEAWEEGRTYGDTGFTLSKCLYNQPPNPQG